MSHDIDLRRVIDAVVVVSLRHLRETIIRRVAVRVDGRRWQDVLCDDREDRARLGVRRDSGDHAASALDHAEYGLLVLVRPLFQFAPMLVPQGCAVVGFVGFH